MWDPSTITEPNALNLVLFSYRSPIVWDMKFKSLIYFQMKVVTHKSWGFSSCVCTWNFPALIVKDCLFSVAILLWVLYTLVCVPLPIYVHIHQFSVYKTSLLAKYEIRKGIGWEKLLFCLSTVVWASKMILESWIWTDHSSYLDI